MYNIETAEDARQLVAGSIIYVDKKPFYVDNIVGGSHAKGFTCSGFFLPMSNETTNELKIINLSDSTVKFDQFSVGYINWGKNAEFLERNSARQYSQGLTAQQLRVRRYHKSEPQHFQYDKFDFRSSLYSQGLADMLRGEYPTFDVAAKLVKEHKATSMAFSRYLAVGTDEFRGDLVLFYKGQKIGWSSDAVNVMLPAHFKHLQEILTESKFKVAYNG